MVTANSIVSYLYDRWVQTPDLLRLLQVRTKGLVISRRTFLTQDMANRKVNHKWCMSNDRQRRGEMSDVAVFVVDGAPVILFLLYYFPTHFGFLQSSRLLCRGTLRAMLDLLLIARTSDSWDIYLSMISRFLTLLLRRRFPYVFNPVYYNSVQSPYRL
jgi:hypothetical protein